MIFTFSFLLNYSNQNSRSFLHFNVIFLLSFLPEKLMHFYLTVHISLVRFTLNNNEKLCLVQDKKDNDQSPMIKATGF